MSIQDLIWAGTENSLQAAIEADEAKTARLSAGNYPEDDEDKEPRLLEVTDGVAVISIKGPLNNSGDFWNEYVGMTGYPEIREAVIAAAQDESVKHILLDIDSGGGAVAGVEDTAKLIRTVDGIKPVTAYCDGTMASAAYWLGAAASTVYTGKTAVVGSIGVLSTHMERSEQLKMDGIGATIIRAGKFKALANGVEKLSADGKAQIQQVVDAAYGVFLESVSEMRGKSVAYVDENMAQGREFVGQGGVDVGLTDGITTFDKLLSSIRSNLASGTGMIRNKPGNGFTGTSTTTLQGESTMAKKALTEQDIAALAAGAAVSVEASTNALIAEAVKGDETEVQAEVTAEVEVQPEAVLDTKIVDNLNASIQLLNSQLSAKDAAILEAGIKISKLEEFKSEFEAISESLKEVAGKAVNNMRIACKAAPLELSALSIKQVLAEHSAIAPTFIKQYPVGGVAAVSTTNVEKNEHAPMDAMSHARIAAVRSYK